MYNVQDYSVLYNNAASPVICECWYFTHMWKAYDRIISLRGEVWAQTTSFIPLLFIEVHRIVPTVLYFFSRFTTI